MDKRTFIKYVRNWQVPQVETALVEEPELAGYVDQSGKTPLHHCAGINAHDADLHAADSIAVAKALLAAGAEVNAVRVIMDEGEEFHARPLWYAVAWGKNYELARFLLESGAEPVDCMWAACWDQNEPLAKLLRSFGAEIDPVFHHETPLLQIVKTKRFKLFKWLIENGANINFQDQHGYACLHYAIKRNHNLGQIEELLRNGADPLLAAGNGVTAISLARRQGKKRVLELLESFASQ
jgi:ankyrin repeat protein